MKECSCSQCIAACCRAPGIFKPGEAEKAAELLGISFEEFKKRILISYHVLPEDPRFYIPRRVSQMELPTDHTMTDRETNMRGQCTFLTDDLRCEIYEARPFECRMTAICEGGFDAFPEVNKAWAEAGDPLRRSANDQTKILG